MIRAAFVVGLVLLAGSVVIVSGRLVAAYWQVGERVTAVVIATMLGGALLSIGAMVVAAGLPV